MWLGGSFGHLKWLVPEINWWEKASRFAYERVLFFIFNSLCYWPTLATEEPDFDHVLSALHKAEWSASIRSVKFNLLRGIKVKQLFSMIEWMLNVNNFMEHQSTTFVDDKITRTCRYSHNRSRYYCFRSNGWLIALRIYYKSKWRKNGRFWRLPVYVYKARSTVVIKKAAWPVFS